MRYLARFLDQTDPTASLKHLAYILVVLSAIGWLTWDLIRGPITPDWNLAFGMLVAAVTTGKIVGSGPSPAPTVGVSASPAPGAVVPETFPAGSDKS